MLTEISKPELLRARSGVWFDAGGIDLHLSVEEPRLAPDVQRHVGLEFADIEGLSKKLKEAGVTIDPGRPAPWQRFFIHDPFGNRLEIVLVKGKFKEQANNPKRPDGVTHEYCPPIHVDSEMDRLLAFLNEYSAQDPVIVSAWLHHRFAQIHPYQDGNGRVARALTSLVLLRADLLPLVVDRD